MGTEQGGYDLSVVEAQDKAKAAAARESVAAMLPQAGESRPLWIVRVLSSLRAWLNKPRSRIGFVLALCACLLQGCATNGPRVLGVAGGAALGFAACHNYFVAETEASERAQIEAGFIPLVKTNADVMRDNALWYGLATIGGGVAGYAVTDWADAEAEEPDVNTTTVNNDNRTVAQPTPIVATPTAPAATE